MHIPYMDTKGVTCQCSNTGETTVVQHPKTPATDPLGLAAA